MAEKEFKAKLVIGGAISSSLRLAIGSTKEGLSSIGKEVQRLDKEQIALNKTMKQFTRQGLGIDTIAASYKRVTDQLEAARRAQNRLNEAQERYHRLSTIGGNLQGAGVQTGIVGAGMSLPVFSTLGAAKSYQQAQARMAGLGLGSDLTRQAASYSAGLNVFGSSKADNLGLMTDALSVFGDLSDAKMVLPMLSKMKFANSALFGSEQGQQNEDAFMNMLKVIELRGGTKDQTEFNRQANMIQQVINATGGKVGSDEWRDAISTGGIAVKGMTDQAFYYGMEPLIQEMGGHRVGTALMSAYNNLYQGHTTKRAADNLDRLGLIGDPSKVKYDKVGQVSYLNPGALKDSPLFKTDPYQWMKTVLLPTLAAHGVTSKDQILDTIGSIFSNRTAANLFATMFLQQSQIDKREKLNAGAQNIDQMNDQAQNTPTGKELNAEARLADLKLRLGTDILPTYTKALELATGALERLNSFTAKHPVLAKDMMLGIAGVGASLLVLGPALLVAGGALSAYAGYTILATKAGLAFPKTISLMLTPLRIALAPIKLVGTAIAWLGRTLFTFGVEFLTTNPIGVVLLALGALAGATYLIYKNWGPISDFFKNLWADVTASFKTAIDWIGGAIDALMQKLAGIKKEIFASFTGDGAQPTPNAPNAFTGRGAGAGAGPQAAPNAFNRRAQAAAPVHIGEVHIHAAPGQDGGKLWDQFERKLRARQGVASRGNMYDPAMGTGG